MFKVAPLLSVREVPGLNVLAWSTLITLPPVPLIITPPVAVKGVGHSIGEELRDVDPELY